jgi:phosphate transport system protein
MLARQHYAERIEALTLDIMKMAALVQEAVGKATQAFVQSDEQLAAQVMEEDRRIDTWERAVEARSTALIATEQPVARDLRVIVAALLVSNELERMGDYAAHFANAASRVSEYFVKSSREEITKMTQIASTMVRDGAEAFLKQDCDLAREVTLRDDEVDGLYARFFQKILVDMTENPQHVQEGTALLFCSKYLERLADHATNICKEVVYVCTGEKYPEKE